MGSFFRKGSTTGWGWGLAPRPAPGSGTGDWKEGRYLKIFQTKTVLFYTLKFTGNGGIQRERHTWSILTTKATGEAHSWLLPSFTHVSTRHPEAHARCWGALFASIDHKFHRLGMTLILLLLLEGSGVSSWMNWTVFYSSLHVLQWAEQWARCTTTPSCFWPT